MQRVVSGEGIHGLSKQYSFSDQIDKEQPTGDYLARNSSENNETMMPYSHSTAFDGTANFVENDGEGYFEDEDDGCVTMDMDDTYATFTSDPIIAGSQLEPQQQQEEIRHMSQRHYSESPSRSISSITEGSNSNSNDTQQRTANATDDQQQQHTPMSIISGLLPTVGLPRNDSRNSGTTTSFGSGLQRSQNSSRDWGWFEDVHHSDQSITGSTNSNAGTAIGNNRTGGNNKSERTTMGGSVASSGANRTSLPQHQLTNTRTGDIVHGIGTGTINNGNERTSIGGQNSSGNHHIEGGGDIANNNKNNWNNRLRPRDRGDNNTKAASLLPTGDEMLIDEMQEYLEPFLIHPRPRDMENEAAVQAVTAPNYVLEESLSDQLLWKRTAGNRPPQPVEERAFFEAMWAENFAASEVNYRMPAEVLTATTPVSLNPFADGNFGTVVTGVIGTGGTPVAEVGGSVIGGANHQDVADIVSSFVVPGGTSEHGVASGHHNTHLQNQPRIVRSNSGSGDDLIVYTKGDNVFGTTVSKSFARPSINGELASGVDTVNISIASYRVVESEKRGKHAQFLVIYREGSIRDTIGVWKRYSDFQELSKKVTKVHEGCATVIVNMSPLAMTEEHDVEHLPNAITSWHLLKKRKRWYRCLDSGYLSLKAFLLERFLHDILFESSTPDLLREFVGVPPPR